MLRYNFFFFQFFRNKNVYVSALTECINENEVIDEKGLASLNSRGRTFQAEENNTQSPGDRKEVPHKN